MSSQEDGGTAIVDLTRDGSSSPNPSDAPMAMTEDSSDLEEIVMENAGIDEEARRQNVENRRARLARFGIDEAAGRARANAARRASVNEVIVISDNEDEGTNAPENMDIDEDRFAFERQRHRERRDEWAARPARARATAPAIGRGGFPSFDNIPPQRANDFWDLPRIVTPPLQAALQPAQPRLPSIRLGGGGFVNFRNRGNPDTFNANNIRTGLAQAMHRRALQLDNERFQGRLERHLDGLLADQELSYPGILDGFREYIGRLGNAVGSLGWRGWGRGEAADAGAGVGPVFGEPREEPDLNLPEAPEYKVYFSHPGKLPAGFTSDFAPIEPDTITLDDSDNDDDAYDPLFDEDESEALRRKREKWRRKKGKGKAPVQTPAAEVQKKPLEVVCVLCDDPLVIGGNEEQKLYGLRCGHVLDGKCLWKIGVPPPIVPPPSTIPEDLQIKGKGKATEGENPSTLAADVSFDFTFNVPKPTLIRHPPADGPSSSTGQYQEDNDPSPVFIPSSIRSRLRSRREIVPTPSASKRKRTRYQDGDDIDDVDDILPSDEHPSTPSFDLTNPFFPTINDPPTATASRGRRRVKTGYARRGRHVPTVGSHGLQTRTVPKTRGKLREEIYEWTCPVEGCGRKHLSVRLDVEGAKWRCDEDEGARGMFL